jgi:hypothetical protein
MLTSDLAWRIAANIAKPPELVDCNTAEALPELLRQLKAASYKVY